MNTHATPPTAAAARKNMASCCIGMAVSGLRAGLLGRVERGREALLLAIVASAFPEARAPDAGRAVPPDQLALGVLAEQVVDEQVLGDDHVAFQAHHLGDVRD